MKHPPQNQPATVRRCRSWCTAAPAALAAENGSGDEELLLSAHDRETVGAAVVDAANAKRPGTAFRLSDETRDTGGGLVLRRDRVELNCSFTEKLRQLRQEESSAVAKLLFD